MTTIEKELLNKLSLWDKNGTIDFPVLLLFFPPHSSVTFGLWLGWGEIKRIKIERDQRREIKEELEKRKAGAPL